MDSPWFNTGDFSGVETSSWLAWIGNHSRTATIWGETEEVAFREALSVVTAAVARREGFFDGHGAVIAPDLARPDDGLFVTGLSGSGKSTLAVSCALGGARFLSDDSVTIGYRSDGLRAWSRRTAMSLSTTMNGALLPGNGGREFDGKIFFDARRTFGERCADSLRVRALVFLERGAHGAGNGGEPAVTEKDVVEAPDAYRRLLMGHPILALDAGARPCFKVVRDLADLPAFKMTGGPELLNPQNARATLSELLPSDERGLR